jgi:hypothetical protein
MPRTSKITNYDGRELHAELPTIVAGFSEAVILGGNTTHSVIGFKPIAGVESVETGVAGTWTITDGVDGIAPVAGIKAAVTLTVTSAPTTTGNWNISLFEDEPVVIEMVNESIADAAIRIRGTTFAGWVLSGSDADVIFTAAAKGVQVWDGGITVGSGGSGSAIFGLPTLGRDEIVEVVAAAQVATLVVDAGAVNNLGDLEVALYAAPVKTITVAKNDSAAVVAGKIRTAGNITGWTVGGSSATVVYTATATGPVVGEVSLTDAEGEVKATSCKLQTTIDDLAHVNAGTAIFKELVGATASGVYIETPVAFPITAVRVETVTPAASSYAIVLIRE